MSPAPLHPLFDPEVWGRAQAQAAMEADLQLVAGPLIEQVGDLRRRIWEMSEQLRAQALLLTELIHLLGED